MTNFPTSTLAMGNRHEVQLEPGELPLVLRKVEDALMANAPHAVFQRGGTLVRLVRVEVPEVNRGVHIAAGSLVIRQAPARWLGLQMMRCAEFMKYSKQAEDWVVVDCPLPIPRTYAEMAGTWRLHTLTGFIECPLLRTDGSLLGRPGFDEATGLYLDSGDVKFPPIPSSPTIQDAIEALAVLEVVIGKFPFVDESDFSAALAAILTAIQRPVLRTAPMFPIRAPKMSSGKSLLADVVALIATGQPAPVMTQGRDEVEEQRRVLSVLLNGHRVSCIDNVEHPLGGAVLCSVLTQPTYRDRVLGSSTTATVSTATTWIATGNNMVLVGDITTRVVPIDLDPGEERPEERKFDINLHEYIPRHRGALVSAALTILRAYEVAGRPDQGLTVFGRFEEWSDSIRSALVWLGLPDPCLGRSRIEDVDPVREALRDVFEAWWELFQDRVLTAKDVVVEVTGDQPSEAQEALADALYGIGKLRSRINAQDLGRWLNKHKDRIEGGYRLVRQGRSGGKAQWQLQRLGGPVSGPDPDPGSGASGASGASPGVAAFPNDASEGAES